MSTEDSGPLPKKHMRPFGMKKRWSLGTLLAMGAGVIVYLQGFAPVCPYLPEGFWRAFCESATKAPAQRHHHAHHVEGDKDDELDGGAP